MIGAYTFVSGSIVLAMLFGMIVPNYWEPWPWTLMASSTIPLALLADARRARDRARAQLAQQA